MIAALAFGLGVLVGIAFLAACLVVTRDPSPAGEPLGVRHDRLHAEADRHFNRNGGTTP